MKNEEVITAILTRVVLAATQDRLPLGVQEAYASLKATILDRYPSVNIQNLEDSPKSVSIRKSITEEIIASGASKDTELIEQARELNEIINNPINYMDMAVDHNSTRSSENLDNKIPVRGSLSLSVSASNAAVTSGSDFSIFVQIKNPFDVPIVVHEVVTQIPVDFVDVVQIRLDQANKEKNASRIPFWSLAKDFLVSFMSRGEYKYSGLAVAVSQDFSAEAPQTPSISLENISAGQDIHISGVSTYSINLPKEFDVSVLDKLIPRLDAYNKGLRPIHLQSGDTLVRQFILRTRQWLFFSPIEHIFHIQVTYSSDNVDHYDSITYKLYVRSSTKSIMVGSITGSIIGCILRILSSSSLSVSIDIPQALLAAVLASVAVVIAFARKASAQSFVSVEDFWGGALIGFSVGFFGFEQFSDLFVRREP